MHDQSQVTETTVCEWITTLLEHTPRTTDQYVRPTIFVKSSFYGTAEGEADVGFYCVSFDVPRNGKVPTSTKVEVSSFRKFDDSVAPSDAKYGAYYAIYRFARLSSAHKGFDDALLLNNRGMVAEIASGASFFLVVGDALLSPPLSSSVLDGITLNTLFSVAREQFGMRTLRRKIPLSQITSADEAGCCSTLTEVCRIGSLDGIKVGKETSTIEKLAHFYRKVVLGEIPEYVDWITAI